MSLVPLNFEYRKYLNTYDNTNLFIARKIKMNKNINYGGGRNEGKTERLMKQVYNEGIEAAAKWLETADRNDTDDAAEIRKLKK